MLQRLYALSCRGYMLSCRGYMHELQRLYAGYSDNKANSAQFQLGLGLSLAKQAGAELCQAQGKLAS